MSVLTLDFCKLPYSELEQWITLRTKIAQGRSSINAVSTIRRIEAKITISKVEAERREKIAQKARLSGLLYKSQTEIINQADLAMWRAGHYVWLNQLIARAPLGNLEQHEQTLLNTMLTQWKKKGTINDWK
jgi:hypothetical protein